MKLIDANAWLGHYPFRAVPDHTPDGLLRLMDRHGIEQAVVSSLHSVFYSDPHSGNEELARWVGPHRDRLIPCATLNPEYPGWERDLKQCCDEWNMRGLRLFPSHHQKICPIRYNRILHRRHNILPGEFHQRLCWRWLRKSFERLS